jgi:cytochrome c-type biogenesis protein CcmH/NrfG
MWLPLGVMIIMMMAGCHDTSPSSDPESANPIVPPFASGSFEEANEPELLQIHPVGNAQTTGQSPEHSSAHSTDPMAAIQQARDRLNKNPNDLHALIFLGNANYDIQRYQEAADLYQKALELNSDNAQVRTDRATALYRLGRSKEAIEELNLALASDAHHENALYNLGMIKLRAFNDRKGALAAWTQLKGMTQDQTLIAELDKRIAELREPLSNGSGKVPGKASAGTGGTASGSQSDGATGPSGVTTTGTVLQLPLQSKDRPK